MIGAQLTRLLEGIGRRPVRSVLVIYALSRVAALLALLVATRFQSPTALGHLDPGLGDMFGLWDGQWYAEIARHGYPLDPPVDPTSGRLTYSAWAFFPLLPALMAPFVALGAPPAVVGAILSTGLGAVAAVLAVQLFTASASPGYDGELASPRSLLRRRWAVAAVAIWCFHPATAVLMQPYTEALAAVLFFGSLLAVQRLRFGLAGVLTLLLGLTRAVAPALAVVVVVVLVQQWRIERRGGPSVLARRKGSIAFLLACIAVSAILWPALVGALTGIPDAFFQIQAAWGQRPGDGPFVPWLRWAWEGHGAFGVAVLVGVVAAYIGLVMGRHGALLGPVLRAAAIAYPLFLLAVVRPITSMWRFILLDLPLAGLLAALALHAGSPSRTAKVVRLGLVLAALLVSTLIWTATVWTQEPFGSSPP